MAYKLVEEAIDVIKSYLSDNMTAKLTALDAEYSDDIVLTGIKQYATAELSAIPEYPTILILGEFSDIVGEAEGQLQASHQLSIVCLATDQDQEALRTRLYRYIRACTELLKEARSSSGWAYIINFVRLEYSPLYTNDVLFLGDVRLIIAARRNESA